MTRTTETFRPNNKIESLRHELVVIVHAIPNSKNELSHVDVDKSICVIHQQLSGAVTI